MADTFRVGQVLYIIPENTANLIPVQITERRISETASGTKVTHIARVPKPKAQPLILETIKGQIFADLRVARESMLGNATSAIDSMIRHAEGVARQAFAPQAPQREALPPQHDDDPFDTSGILVDDGPPLPSNGGSHHSLPAPVMHVPQSIPAPPEFHGADDDGFIDVMLPNGEKKRVRPKS